MTEDQVQSFKVVLLGESAVGKTSLIVRYMRNYFSMESTPTIGASFLSKQMTVNERKIDVALWDTAGQEMYRSLTPMYFRNAQAAVVVFDVTNESSFKRAREWIDDVQYHNEEALIYLCGNKVDMDTKRVVTRQEAEDFAAEKKLSYSETSAATGVGVEMLFGSVVNAVLEKSLAVGEEVTEFKPLVGEENNQDDKKCC